MKYAKILITVTSFFLFSCGNDDDETKPQSYVEFDGEVIELNNRAVVTEIDIGRFWLFIGNTSASPSDWDANERGVILRSDRLSWDAEDLVGMMFDLSDSNLQLFDGDSYLRTSSGQLSISRENGQYIIEASGMLDTEQSFKLRFAGEIR